MESSNLQALVLSFIKKNILISCLFVGGMILLGVGLIQYFSGSKNDITFQKGAEVQSASTPSELTEIVVDVSGEVNNPGVYKLSSTARVKDALTAAGGLGLSADTEFVSRSINLAAVLRDGIKIYIPKMGEAPVSSSVSNLGQSSSDIIGISSNGIVSINSASQSELEALPGIGPVTAGKIINGRPYSSVDELLSKKVVGQSVYGKIKDLVGL